MNRRQSFQLIGSAAALTIAPQFLAAGKSKSQETSPLFHYCLNTSTINSFKLGVKKSVEIAAKAGYEYAELWIPDIKKFVGEKNSLQSLKQFLRDSNVKAANAIGFAPWMLSDDAERKKGFLQMEEEMNIMADLDCKRIAAAPAGLKQGDTLDLMKVGEYYKQLLDLGRKTGVMPQLEFWGVSPVFYHLGQVLMVAAVANDPDTRILADVFHLFRGGSGFDGMKLVDGHSIEVFHMNDFPSTPREEQKDKDRVFPGDGVGPVKQLIRDLGRSQTPVILSLELFNESYWNMDPLEVAKNGLEKMKTTVKSALTAKQ